RLPLGLEPGHHGFRVHAQLDDLECHAATDGFLLFGDIDHAAAALAEVLAEFVAADAVPGTFGHRNHAGGDHESFGGNTRRTLFEEFAGLVVRLQECLDAFAQ